MSTLFRVEREPAAAHGLSDVAVVRLYGPLFFGAVAKLEALVDDLPPGTSALVLDAHQLVSIDASGLTAFENMHRVLARNDIRLVVVGAQRAAADGAAPLGPRFGDRRRQPGARSRRRLRRARRRAQIVHAPPRRAGERPGLRYPFGKGRRAWDISTN